MKLDIFLDISNDQYSIESLAILALVDYCDLKNQDISFYSLKCSHVSDYEIKFVDDLNKLSPYITDVSLPAIVKHLPNNLSIVYTGLASLYRVLVKYKIYLKDADSVFFQKLLGYKSACLKACSEVSKWTNLCEILPIELLRSTRIEDFKTKFLSSIEETLSKPLSLANRKSNNLLKERYLEDIHVNISDLLVYFYIQIYSAYEILCGKRFKLICEWIELMKNSMRLEKLNKALLLFKPNNIEYEDQLSKQLKTLNLNYRQAKTNEIDNLIEQFEKETQINNYNIYTGDEIKLDWYELNEQANPSAGKLPFKRIERKCQQLENFAYLIKKFEFDKKESFTVVDFCSGGGHLGILLAYLYPKLNVKLIDNKEESLEFGIDRISKLGLTNVHIYKGNLNNFIGNFNLGLAIHACGTATDLIISKCINSKASIIISPCCYGSIKENERIKYPRSVEFLKRFDSKANLNYESLVSFADRTEKDKKYEHLGYLAMNIVDSDRIMQLNENNYKQTLLTKLLPETCSTKNNLIVGIYE